MKKIGKSLMALALIGLLAVSCGKDGSTGPQGATGPAGPAGTNGTNGTNGTAGVKGATGATGVKGATGATGTTGTANVIYSDWLTPNLTFDGYIFEVEQYDVILNVPQITQDILDNGTIIVYGKMTGYSSDLWPTDRIATLPITINYYSGTTLEADTWAAYSSPGTLRIVLTNNNNTIYGNGTEVSNQTFRYVIIPGGVHSLSSINPQNYNEVKQVLHLKD